MRPYTLDERKKGEWVLYLFSVISFPDCAGGLAVPGGFHGACFSTPSKSRKYKKLLAKFGAFSPARAGPPEAKGFQNITDCIHGNGRIAERAGRAN